MKRMYCLVIIVVSGLVLSGPLHITPQSDQAFAQSKPKPKLKACRSKLPNGKIKSWRCKANQPCCVNHTMSIYVCGSPIIGCL